MPFVSKAQQRALYAKAPAVAREFSKGMTAKDFKKLPEFVKPKPQGKKK